MAGALGAAVAEVAAVVVTAAAVVAAVVAGAAAEAGALPLYVILSFAIDVEISALRCQALPALSS